MTHMLRSYVMVAIAMLTACDQKPKVESKPPQIFTQERGALDKAKDVENTVEQQAAETRKKIDDAEK
jgi:hypothetical protein